MDGPVHRIAIDETGSRIAIAYGKEVIVLDQNTLCKSCMNFTGTRRQLTLTASLLDQWSEAT